MRLTFLEYSRINPSADAQLSPTTVITMPLPMSVPDSTSLRIGQGDFGALGNINLSKLQDAYNAKGVEGMIESGLQQGITGFSDSIKSYTAGQSGYMKAIHDLAVAPGISDANNRVRQFAQRTVGVVTNPHTNSFFEGVNLRTNQLSWRLAPKSAQESQALLEIRDRIKQRIHPSETLNNYALDYPDLVDVEIIGDAQKYLNKYYRAFVADFNASPGNGNGMSFFTDGSPTEWEFSMRLVELNVVTRDRLEGTT